MLTRRVFGDLLRTTRGTTTYPRLHSSREKEPISTEDTGLSERPVSDTVSACEPETLVTVHSSAREVVESKVDGLIKTLNSKRGLFGHKSIDYERLNLHDKDDTDVFNVKSLFTVDDLFENGVHLGHSIGCWNPANRKYLFGARNGIHLIDLANTEQHLWRALNVVSHIAARGGNVVFINERDGVFTSKRTRHFTPSWYYYHGGFNPKRIEKLKPDLIVCSSVMCTKSQEMLQYCNKNLIPTIGILDSDCNATNLTYVVPGNDDSTDALVFYHEVFNKAIYRAKFVTHHLMLKEIGESVRMEE